MAEFDIDASHAPIEHYREAAGSDIDIFQKEIEASTPGWPQASA